MSDQNDLPEAAKRALAEAEERRRKAKELELPKELGGREGCSHRKCTKASLPNTIAGRV